MLRSSLASAEKVMFLPASADWTVCWIVSMITQKLPSRLLQAEGGSWPRKDPVSFWCERDGA